ncbi:hypothetical protein B0O99DRAFT_589710 [Bisporella sp. PMI_857]|nr:hypothetical protein B0O99DRAFT_589710 [Bisporella sp. PMI_857]
MIYMEGILLMPPERGILIGRAVWKPRYVVFGTGAQLKAQHELMVQSESKAGSSRKDLKSTSSKPSLVDVTTQDQDQTLYISICKTKGDREFVAQHSISSFASCEIRNVQHRKQMPSLPTMMLEFKSDAPTERARKRRSSRTGGLTSKDPWASTLLFRTVPDERYNIYDWQTAIKSQLRPESHEHLEDLNDEMSPLSPTFFTNPFAPKDARDTRTPTSSNTRPEILQRASSQNTTSSTYPHAPRDRPSAVLSPSPSLRSRRSDLSSQSSSMPPPMGFATNHSKQFTTLPSDLPSPASTSGYDHQFIEGWTSAQGRTSALSSHTRGSNSIASAVAGNAFGSTPPGPRETILDRAFQMRCIPGSERVQDKDEEKISSIAKFEALMREIDERKMQKSTSTIQNTDARSGWSLDEESEESSSAEGEDEDDGMDMSDQEFEMPTPAQRALEYISGRRTPISPGRSTSPTSNDPPIPFLNPQAMSAFHGIPPSINLGGLRPRTGTSTSKRHSRPTSLALPSRSVSAVTMPGLKDFYPSTSSSNLRAGDFEVSDIKRSSSTSVKRLSFQEFTKRLSSTSSLLLVQTNASSSSGKTGSRRTSSEYGVDEERNQRNSVQLRGGSGATCTDRDKRCGWRGSVGVFGKEGGFL